MAAQDCSEARPNGAGGATRATYEARARRLRAATLLLSPGGSERVACRSTDECWAKTDRLDARTLARLLAAGSLDGVWMPDRWTWMMRRRLSRRSQLVWARSRAKNQIHAVLMRQLVGRPPFADVFGVKGRAVALRASAAARGVRDGRRCDAPDRVL